MNWRKTIAIIGGIVLIVAFVFKLKSNKETATERIYQYDKEQAINVQTQVVKLENIDAKLSYSGIFEPNRETKISAETQGKINQIAVDAGDFVSEGQTLIQLDNTLLLQQLNVVEVQIENAKVEYQVQLNANQIQIDNLKKDVNRYSILAQSDAIQGVQLEKAEMQLQTAENQRVALLQQSGLKTAEAQRKNIIAQINKTTIRAPFSGIVTMKFSEVGAFAAPGVPLLQITDIGQLKFTINVSENELNHFQLNKRYPLSADVYPDIPLLGKSTLIGSKANVGGLYPVQFTLKNLEGSKIKSGMFGKIYATPVGENENTEKAYLIPSSAVIGNADQPKVYLVKNGKAILENITILSRIQDKSVVSSGIHEGDVLVTNGLINLFEGANVTYN